VDSHLLQRYSVPIRRALDYIHAHPTAPCVLAILAALAGLSLFHFCRRFRQEVGATPCQYVLSRRVELAKAKLTARPWVPLVEVALACGFSNQSHFTTAFRRATGMTPRAYRLAHSDP
jgi:AraC family transcriptional regulator